jgi:hypothetical protein
MQPVAGFTGRELMLSVLPPTLPSIVRLPGRRESGTLSRRSAGRNAKMSDQPRSSAAPVEAYFDARRSPSAGLRDEAEAKQRDHENRTESRAEPEVRIQFPPARSLRTISSEAAKLPLPFFQTARPDLRVRSGV